MHSCTFVVLGCATNLQNITNWYSGDETNVKWRVAAWHTRKNKNNIYKCPRGKAMMWQGRLGLLREVYLECTYP